VHTPLLKIEAANHRRTLTDTQTHTDTETQRCRDAETKKHRNTDTKTHIHTDAQTHINTNAQTQRHRHMWLASRPLENPKWLVDNLFICLYHFLQLSAGTYWNMWRNYLEGCRITSDTLFRSFFWKKVIEAWHEQVDLLPHFTNSSTTGQIAHTEP